MAGLFIGVTYFHDRGSLFRWWLHRVGGGHIVRHMGTWYIANQETVIRTGLPQCNRNRSKFSAMYKLSHYQIPETDALLAGDKLFCLCSLVSRGPKNVKHV